MKRWTCSPRAENLLEIARTTVAEGRVPAAVAERFTATQGQAPQRGLQELGLGLCGRGVTRLARRLGEVSCEDCLELLGAPGGGLHGPLR